MPIEKLRPSFTFTEDRLKELQAVAPEAFADGMIDWDTLREAIGEYLEEENQEHYGLFWPGKRDARRLAAMPSKGTLVPQPGQGVNEETTHNIFIEGDNLEVLKLLRKSYAGSVKMIYIDPPYNTGNDLIYFDDYKISPEDFLKELQLVNAEGTLLSTNSRADGRFHSKWLNMMYPRLILARDMLTEDGVIFVSIDDNEAHNLRQLMSEVFGEENFVADIVVVNNLKGRNDKAHIATAHERLLIFKRPTFTEVGLDLSEEQKKDYNLVGEDGGRYRLLGLRKRGGADTREKRPNLFYPIYINPSQGEVSLHKDDTYTIEVFPQKSDGSDGAWRWGGKKVEKERRTLIGLQKSTGAWDVFQVDYLEKDGAVRRMKPKSVWFGTDYSTDSATKEFKKLMGDCGFSNPKPVPLLVDLVRYATQDDDLIVDFFAGSCTTAHAVYYSNSNDGSNRKFIMVQIPEKTEPNSQAQRAGYHLISDIGKERIRRAIKQIIPKDKFMLSSGDFGFKAFRFEPSNFKEWQPYYDKDAQELQLHFDQSETPLIDGWKPERLNPEILLLQGFPLDSRIILLDAYTANTVQRVHSEFCDHELFICLDTRIAEDTIRLLNLREHDIFVCLDRALTDEAKIRLADRCNLKVI